VLLLQPIIINIMRLLPANCFSGGQRPSQSQQYSTNTRSFFSYLSYCIHNCLQLLVGSVEKKGRHVLSSLSRSYCLFFAPRARLVHTYTPFSPFHRKSLFSVFGQRRRRRRRSSKRREEKSKERKLSDIFPLMHTAVEENLVHSSS